MNLEELATSCQLYKASLFTILDQLKVDVKKIEDALCGLPLNQKFEYPVYEEGNPKEVGTLCMNKDRVHFHWTSHYDGSELVFRPLVEYPVHIRLLCSKELVNFFHAVLKDLGVNV